MSPHCQIDYTMHFPALQAGETSQEEPRKSPPVLSSRQERRTVAFQYRERGITEVLYVMCCYLKIGCQLEVKSGSRSVERATSNCQRQQIVTVGWMQTEVMATYDKKLSNKRADSGEIAVDGENCSQNFLEDRPEEKISQTLNLKQLEESNGTMQRYQRCNMPQRRRGLLTYLSRISRLGGMLG